jgi:hypothetical protein
VPIIRDFHRCNDCKPRTIIDPLSGSLYPTFLRLTFSFFFIVFFGLTARVIPLRYGLRVFCFIGSALNDTGFPPIKQTLACDFTPPRSLSCPKENGAERKGKNKMSYLFRSINWLPRAERREAHSSKQNPLRDSKPSYDRPVAW